MLKKITIPTDLVQIHTDLIHTPIKQSIYIVYIVCVSLELRNILLKKAYYILSSLIHRFVFIKATLNI